MNDLVISCLTYFILFLQICIAPDYLLCHPSIQEKLVKEMEKAIKEFFGEVNVHQSSIDTVALF